jgi:hypothetical protein
MNVTDVVALAELVPNNWAPLKPLVIEHARSNAEKFGIDHTERCQRPSNYQHLHMTTDIHVITAEPPGGVFACTVYSPVSHMFYVGRRHISLLGKRTKELGPSVLIDMHLKVVVVP